MWIWSVVRFDELAEMESEGVSCEEPDTVFGYVVAPYQGFDLRSSTGEYKRVVLGNAHTVFVHRDGMHVFLIDIHDTWHIAVE